MEIERHRGWIRFALIYLTVTIGVVSVWILLAPKGFYNDFPGGPAHWVSALPPYNEHLERDFGAAGLGLALLAGLAAFWMERRLVQAAAICLFAAGAPTSPSTRPPPATTRRGTTPPASLRSPSTCSCRWPCSTWRATTRRDSRRGARAGSGRGPCRPSEGRNPGRSSVLAGDQVPGAPELPLQRALIALGDVIHGDP